MVDKIKQKHNFYLLILLFKLFKIKPERENKRENRIDIYDDDAECFYSLFTFHRFLQKSEHFACEMNVKEEIKSEKEKY